MYPNLIKKIVMASGGVLSFLLIWSFASMYLFSNQTILPSPFLVLKALKEMFDTGDLSKDVFSSLLRILVGFFLAFGTALFFGVIAYRFSQIYQFVKTVMNVLSSIPPIAWTPLAILWFGIGNAPAYFIVFLGAFFPMFSNFYAGIKEVDKELIDAAKTLGATNSEITYKVIFPFALPKIFLGIKVGLGVAWFNVIAAELIGVKTGLGYKIQLNRQLLASENVIALMLVIGIIGLLMTGVVYTVSNLTVPWSLQDETRESWLKYHTNLKRFFSGFKNEMPNEEITLTTNPTVTLEGENKEIFLCVDKIKKTFDSKDAKEKLLVFSNISFSILKGEIVSIVGPNGCGKTTIINVIAGLLKADSGKVIFDGKVITAPSSDRTVVFQNYALFPWLTAKQNIEFALHVTNNKANNNANDFLVRAGIADFTDNYPFQLSGGMKQRLAIMRAVSANPKLILMDEPFASLDPLIRNNSQEIILDLLKKQNDTTILIVTHDIDEAIFMSDKIIVLSQRPASIKEIVEVDLPRPRKSLIRQSDYFVEKKNYIWNTLQS